MVRRDRGPLPLDENRKGVRIPSDFFCLAIFTALFYEQVNYHIEEMFY